MSVTYIYESRIVFSSVTTEPKRFVLLIQVERVDKFFGVQHVPGDSIRPVYPIVFDRIRVGFQRNPTSSIKIRSDPMGSLSILFSRNPAWISSEFNGIRSSLTRSDPNLVGFRRLPMKSEPVSD